jgi:hypothetical protein
MPDDYRQDSLAASHYRQQTFDFIEAWRVEQTGQGVPSFTFVALVVNSLVQKPK